MDRTERKELRPIWEKEIYRETITMITEEDGSFGELLYTPEGAVTVESYDGKTLYQEGKDYILDGRRMAGSKA